MSSSFNETEFKIFLQLPLVYKTIIKYMDDTSKNMEIKFKGKTVLPIFLYYDDVEMGNPLGSHSGIHKLGCVYYTIAGLPSEYLSSLDNIFAAYLFHSNDRETKFSNSQLFSALIKELLV